ncbi:MAG: hypothetical protein ISR83_09285 [Candidatus Marinimicrobia bacterium]|nr:hypothetical protein [Candidatus Neomarinimicrobiota bacterium]
MKKSIPYFYLIIILFLPLFAGTGNVNPKSHISRHSHAVLGRNSDSNTNGGLTVDYQYDGFTLANGADEIILIDPYGNTIDSVAYDGGTAFPDPNGRLVNTLVKSQETAGYKAVKWAGDDSNGYPVSAGLYLYEISAGDFRQVKKMVLLK